MPRCALVAGAGGFIGGHLVKSLLSRGLDVRSVDIKPFERWYQRDERADNLQLDLSRLEACLQAAAGADEIYNLACDMGGMGFIEDNKALCMLSSLANTHLLLAARDVYPAMPEDGYGWEKLFGERMARHFQKTYRWIWDQIARH